MTSPISTSPTRVHRQAPVESRTGARPTPTTPTATGTSLSGGRVNVPTSSSAAYARNRMGADPMALAWRLRLEPTALPTGAAATTPGAAATTPSAAATTPGAAATTPPPPALPTGELARGAQGPEVQAVQQALVDSGYMSAADMATGPGTFGPRTQAAIERLQRDSGVPVTGRYDAATRDALSAKVSAATDPNAPPTAPAGDLRRGASGPEVAQLQDSLVNLGYLSPEDKATGPGTYGPRTEAAVRRFQLDHGLPPTGSYDAATRDWMTRRLAGEAAPPPPPPGELPTSATDANRHFVTQFTSAYNPTGPSSSANCGPASVAMALDAAGKMPAGLTPEQRIDYARALMNPNVTPTSYVEVDGQRIPQLDKDHDFSGTGQVISAFNGAGGNGYSGSGWEELDAALRAGHPVVADGYYSQSGWGATLATAGTEQGYTSGYAGGGSVGHFNAILGLTPEGKYIVADPMYTGGTVELTREQLEQYFSPTNGTPAFTVLG